MARAMRRTLFVAVAALLPTAAIVGVTMTANAATGFPAHYAAPYLQISTSTAGDMMADKNATGLKYYTLAFLTPKSGCTPQWEDGNEALNAFTSQVSALQNAGGNVIISFGGASGGELAETCTSVTSLISAYQNVVNIYHVTRLDFDIEGSVLDNTSANTRRNQALAALQAANSSVQVDFTVPVDPSGIESNVVNLLKDAKSKGVKVNMVNIMTMDFGNGENALADSESAANGLHGQLGGIFTGLSSAQLWAMEGLTVIAGQNDDDEVFSQSNASTLESFAAARGVQELAFWEVHDYDKPTGYAYSKIFNRISGSAPSPTAKPTSTATGGTGNTYVGGGSGKCLDDPNGATANGTQLDIQNCGTSGNEKFTYTGGTLQVNGECVTVEGASVDNNARIILYTCNGKTNQAWTYTNSTFVGGQSGKCITVQGASTSAGALILLYTCNGKTNQVWTRG
jgi:chitinase